MSRCSRAGFGALAPEERSRELKGMVNRKKQALLAAGQSRRRIPTTEAIQEWLDQVMAGDPLWGWVFAVVATYGLRPHEAAWVERYQLGGANGEQRLAELRARYKPRYVNEEGQAFDPTRDAVKRCETAPAQGEKPRSARNAACPTTCAMPMRFVPGKGTTWSYADVAAVMGHSPEVHRRTYLQEISGEQTKAAVVRRLLGEGQVA